MDILSLIRLARSRKASDLHLSVDHVPLLRINGALEPAGDMPPLKAEDISNALEQVTTDKDRKKFQDTLELDFAYTIPGLVRLRCNAAMQRGTISLSLRLIPTVIPAFEELSLPDVCREMALRPGGMVVVTGPTGSGKSTTLAAMIDYLNHNESRRIVTIEDPIEYVHSDDHCAIIQRELGDDTLSFALALKHVLRQDPDVIMVGEMRDVETAAAVLTIAETGHLVFTTGHAPSTPQAVERIIDLFPPHERFLAQVRLASLLVGILCQKLIPTIDGTSRIPAVEIMLANTAVRNLIREGKIHQLFNTIRTHRTQGMQLMDHSLVDLYKKGLISGKSLLALCNDHIEVEKLCGEIKTNVTEPSEQDKPTLLYAYSSRKEEVPVP